MSTVLAGSETGSVEALERRVERLERRLESASRGESRCAHCEEGVVEVVDDLIRCDGCGYRCYL
ncbi:hypothetical protein [Natronorarus salvus]|uniref:hypothetical protein n=1 Tax=Natronorarus salvus TaxID=3117733 RepID=UPI002F25EE79